MESKDLRIGNSITFEEDAIPSIVTGINVGDDNRTSVWLSSDYYTIEAYLSECSPIPLTEEWLLKFGFVLKDQPAFIGYESGTYPEYRINTFSLILKDGYYKLWIECEDDWYNFAWTELNTVHQLQNLYYTLTGEELTLKS